MKRTKFIFSTLLVICSSLLFTSCDDLLNDFNTFEMDLGEVSFNIPIELDPNSSSLSSSQLNNIRTDVVSFSGNSGPISLQSDMFKDLREYSNSPITLLVSGVKIRVTTTSESGRMIRDFTATTTGTVEKLVYQKEDPIYIETDFVDPELTEYMKEVFLAIQDNKTVSIDVAGLTDIIPSETEETDVTTISIIPRLKAEIKITKG